MRTALFLLCGPATAHVASRVVASTSRVVVTRTGAPRLVPHAPRSAPVAVATATVPTSQALSRVELAQLASAADFVFATDKRPVILFDGVCALCNGGVDFMLSWDRPNELHGAFRFAALQSDVGKALLARAGRQPDDLSSIVLVLPDGKALTKSDAILEIGRRCGGGTLLEAAFPVASLFGRALPKPVRDVVYEQVARNRYNLFGHSDTCRFSDERFSARFIESLQNPTC